MISMSDVRNLSGRARSTTQKPDSSALAGRQNVDVGLETPLFLDLLHDNRTNNRQRSGGAEI
jgi:hypothetical protein